jgi:hypothetical protein
MQDTKRQQSGNGKDDEIVVQQGSGYITSSGNSSFK